MSELPPSARVVYITVPSEEKGVEIARALVGERLAACVNVVPGIRSIYRWEGKIADDKELLLVVKTTEERLGSLFSRVRELHPYTVPEIIALPIVAGSADYLAWIDAETSRTVF